jgi:transcriptional regulator with XRE-family HTH domain
MDFGSRLAKLREDAKMSQSALARTMGISQSAISQLEAGERTPSFDMIRQVAQALGVTPAYLLGADVTNLTPEETALFRQYRSLPQAARKELEDFTAWLRVKHGKAKDR